MPQTLFAGDGPAARAQASFDWSRHPLGIPADWPASLKVAIRLIMAAPASMYITWGPEEFFFYNDAYVPALGAKEPFAAGSTLPSLWHDVYDQVRPMVADARRGIANRFEDIPLRMARGGDLEDTWWSFFFSPIFDEHGTVVGMLCQTNESTDKALRYRQLLSIERDYRALSDQMEARVSQQTSDRGRVWELSNDLLAVSSTGDYLEATNPAWTRILGWQPVELASLAYPNFIHPEDVARTHNAFQEVRDGAPMVRLDNRLKMREGKFRWFAWSIVGEDGHFYCSARDITEDKAQAAALEKAEEQLRQAQKMDAVGQLTGGIAHDFNNILGGILGALEVSQLRLEQGKVEDIPKLLNLATASAQRAAALTHRLLAFSRRQTLDPKAMDINRLVAGLEDMIARTIGPAVQLEVVRSANLWPVFADPSQVDNALLNLCINARDAMPHGGRLTIETANRWIDHRTAKDRGVRAGQYVSLCVSDSGMGMSADTQARAFDPFFTTKPLGQGTGLGLSMIYGFARQSDGDVRIYSEEGKGTMVCLYLPRHHGEAIIEPDPLVGTAEPGAGEAILVVEDEASIRMLVVSVLSEQGYLVMEAKDGPEALAIVRSKAAIDLLISDVGLPSGMNGRQVADAAREVRPGLPVLFMTGYAENAVISHGHLDPGMEVMTKPFALADLLQRVRTQLDGSTEEPPPY